MGKKERAKDLKNLTHVTHHLNSHSVNRRLKAIKHLQQINFQIMYNYINIFDFLTTGFFGCDQEILVIFWMLKPELAQKINRFS